MTIHRYLWLNTVEKSCRRTETINLEERGRRKKKRRGSGEEEGKRGGADRRRRCCIVELKR